MSTILVKKDDFMTFLELNNAQYIHTPSYNNCRLFANITLPCGAELRFIVNTFNVTPTGTFYGRHDEWNCVELHTWMYDNFSMTGKGSRCRQAEQEAWEMLSLLGKFEGFNPNSII